MGQKGRLNFLATHERNLCCYQWLEVIRNTISRSSAVAVSTPVPALGGAMAPAGSLRPAAR